MEFLRRLRINVLIVRLKKPRSAQEHGVENPRLQNIVATGKVILFLNVLKFF